MNWYLAQHSPSSVSLPFKYSQFLVEVFPLFLPSITQRQCQLSKPTIHAFKPFSQASASFPTSQNQVLFLHLSRMLQQLTCCRAFRGSRLHFSMSQLAEFDDLAVWVLGRDNVSRYHDTSTWPQGFQRHHWFVRWALQKQEHFCRCWYIFLPLFLSSCSC